MYMHNIMVESESTVYVATMVTITFYCTLHTLR